MPPADPVESLVGLCTPPKELLGDVWNPQPLCSTCPSSHEHGLQRLTGAGRGQRDVTHIAGSLTSSTHMKLTTYCCLRASGRAGRLQSAALQAAVQQAVDACK